MVSLPTGSDELIYIQTDKVSVTIKGPASHPNFQGVEHQSNDSCLQISCDDEFQLSLKGNEALGPTTETQNAFTGNYVTMPLFYEQQRYELIIEPEDDCDVSFWHENLTIRNKITQTGRRNRILSGIINFGNEIGMSDLIIKVNGVNYLRITIEVFPTKVSYRDDYKAIVEDVTREVYNVIFDFLKKTYLGYQQNDRRQSSPVEFFAVIRKIYDDFIRAVDLILSQPHHVLETIHEVTPQHKAKRMDAQSRKWIEKHPQQAQLINGQVLVNKVLSSKKIVTYDTKENRLTKYILMSTVKRLESFKRNYLHLQRKEDAAVIALLDEMIKGLNRRCNTSFLQGVSAYEATSGMSLVFSMAPGYRDLYKYYLMLLRGLSVTGDVFNISVKDLAVLYEYWCFIKLNSMMKERYQLVSQDIIRVQGNGLYVSLVKGQGSRVKYRNPHNGETITLSYNPKAVNVPTVTQRPDNVLTLEKKGAQMQYEYVFDAKYRLNPALPGTDYYNAISHTPGPEVDDINTMHRYRDAIVYRNGASPFERTMFGAYVLFPYNNEAEYQNHRFYESIRKVNIGGIPFLPSAVDLVSDMLDELIADSPESAFERATLPVGIEDRLAKVDWNARDVLIGSLRTAEQLDVCLQHGFYHIPAKRIKDSDFPIRYVALYQSGKKFGGEAGVQYYGEVTKCIPLPRSEITEIPKDSDELYYRFEVKEWKKLKKRVLPKERGFVKSFTNMFLLEHSSEMPELWLRSEEEYRLYTELRRALKSVEIDDYEDVGFKYDNSLIVFDQGEILLYQDGTIQGKYDVKDFSRTPNAIFRRIHKQMEKSEGKE